MAIDFLPVSFTKTVKYLGVILDFRLTIKDHIKYFTDKCNKRLNLLRSLTGTVWGTGKESLLIVYRGLIRSILDYSCFIYNNICLSLFKKLEVLQNKALRVVCGAYNSTPGAVLQVETGELPLRLRFKLLNILYSLKCIHSPEHPTKNIFLDTPESQYPYNSLNDIYNEYKENINIPIYGHQISSNPNWHFPVLRIDTSLTTNFSKDNSSLISKTQALSLLSYYDSHIQIFTDGSRIEDKTAYGMYIPRYSIKEAHRLTDGLSIFTVELFAIFKALLWIQDVKPPRSIICTDSLSSVKSIQSYDNKINYLVKEILILIDCLNKSGLEVWLIWIPAHVGISGNEVADQLAKEAARSQNTIITIPATVPEIKSKLLLYILNIWQSLWDITECGLFYKTLVPEVSYSIPFLHSNRALETTLTRLRVNHNCLNYNTYRIGLRDSPLCDLCLQSETVEHFLLYCHKFTALQVSTYLKFKERGIPYNLENLLGAHRVGTELSYEYILQTERFRSLYRV